jgi:NTP pyrophosphatase (non-canonical NTP hydrolase)
MARYGTVVKEALWVQDKDAQIMNALLGIAGEAGEILDFYKKKLFHPSRAQKDVDLRLEEGDLLFYLALFHENHDGDSLLEVAKDNIRKLQRRWPDRYNDVDVEALTL